MKDLIPPYIYLCTMLTIGSCSVQRFDKIHKKETPKQKLKQNVCTRRPDLRSSTYRNLCKLRKDIEGDTFDDEMKVYVYYG